MFCHEAGGTCLKPICKDLRIVPGWHIAVIDHTHGFGNLGRNTARNWFRIMWIFLGATQQFALGISLIKLNEKTLGSLNEFLSCILKGLAKKRQWGLERLGCRQSLNHFFWMDVFEMEKDV